MITVKRKVHLSRKARGRKVISTEKRPSHDAPAGRIPRISRLMALAITFDRMLRDGTVKDITELARLAHVSQPRMTQIMNLNHLAPDIQEALLFLPPVTKGREPVHEKGLREVCGETTWSTQRRNFATLNIVESTISRN